MIVAFNTFCCSGQAKMFLYHQRFELTSPFTPLPCAGATAATLTRWTTPPSGNLFNLIVSLVQAPAYRNFIVPALNPSPHMNQHITTPTWTTTKVNLNLNLCTHRRGYMVYKQVCAACHSMRYLAYRFTSPLNPPVAVFLFNPHR